VLLLIWKQILIILLLTGASLFLFTFLKAYVIPKYKIKKRYLIILLIILFLLPVIVPNLYVKNLFFQYAQIILICIDFLTYLEAARIEKENKNKPVIGRPKAKPNRIKNKNE
jgi:hypothetical protein